MYDEYRHLAENLGLRLSCDPGMMTFVFDVFGEVDGHPISLRRTCGSGARVDITTPLRPYLDLGFGLTRTGVISKVAEWFGKHDIAIGDEPFDASHTVRADEPERARALLTPALRSVVSAISMPDFEVRDGDFQCGYRVPSTVRPDERELEAHLREAVRVARAIGEAAAHVPPAAELRAHYELLASYARDRGLRIAATPLWLEGTLGEAFVIAHARRAAPQSFVLELRARLGQSAPATLSITARSDASDATTFEQAFETRTDHPELVGDDLRRQFLDLRREGHVWLRGSEIVLRPPFSPDPSRIPGLLERLAETITTADRARRGAGAYR